MLLLNLLVPAFAADPALPVLNAQRFRPSIDAERSLWTDDSSVGDPGRFGARGLLSLTSRPLVFLNDDGDVVDIVGGILQLDAAAGYTMGPIRAGVDLPIYLRTWGGLAEDTTDLGDLALDVKGQLLDREAAPVGLAVDGRLAIPTSAATSLATTDFAGELSAIVDADVGDLRLAANLGAWIVPAQTLTNTDYGSQMLFRVSGGYALSETGGISLDLNGNTTFAERDPDAGFPMEVMAGGWTRVGDDGVVLRGGLGTGLTAGIGSPDFRAVIGVGYEPEPLRDADGDGIWDKDDACVNEAEDPDGVDDTDGCPDPTKVKLVFVDKDTRQPILNVTAGIAGRESADLRELALKPDTYPLQASAAGYKTVRTMVDVPPGREVERTVVLEKDVIPGRLLLKVVDAAGAPVEATISAPGLTVDRPTTSLDRSLPAGELAITASAPGYVTAHQTAVVKQGDTTTIVITLNPAKAVLTGERIDIKDSVYFETGKAVIKPESYALLDEVAGILADHPELLLIRIEGHTDSRGSDSANLSLSDRRAAAVREYLVSKGIAADRLASKGYGESRPLVKGENEAAWSKNRRVDFFVEKRK